VPLDLTDPRVVKELDKANRAYTREDGNVLKELMKTMAGRAFVWRKLGPILFGSAFNENPYSMAYNVGIQRQGVALFGDISKYCPEELSLMMREAHERDASIESAAESAGRQDRDGGDQGSGEYQLDLYRDLATGKISVEYEPGSEGTEAFGS
jgi:hypothetical protein